MSDELSDAVAELYRLPPEDFVSARAERVTALRDSGDKDAAKQVAALRKPTVGAWLVNLLVGDDPSLSDQVSALADQLRTAQEQLSGEDLRALGRQRQELVSGLVARARGLAKDAGRSVTGSVLNNEVESSLRAALADPDVARAMIVRGIRPERRPVPLTIKESGGRLAPPRRPLPTASARRSGPGQRNGSARRTRLWRQPRTSTSWPTRTGLPPHAHSLRRRSGGMRCAPSWTRRRWRTTRQPSRTSRRAGGPAGPRRR
jgi:hypothetical protein